MRRSGAFPASAGLLAPLTVAAVATPASAGKCEEWPGSGVEGERYYVGQTPIADTTVVDGFTLNGSDEADVVLIVMDGGISNGGGGGDHVATVFDGGTFNGGAGNDSVDDVECTFNGGPGDDRVISWRANWTRARESSLARGDDARPTPWAQGPRRATGGPGQERS
jgi:hypothetical protein